MRKQIFDIYIFKFWHCLWDKIIYQSPTCYLWVLSNANCQVLSVWLKLDYYLNSEHKKINFKNLYSSVLCFSTYMFADVAFTIHRCHGISDHLWFSQDRVLQTDTNMLHLHMEEMQDSSVWDKLKPCEHN